MMSGAGDPHPTGDNASVGVGCEHAYITADPAQIAIFTETVFSWCEGMIPLRGIAEKGHDLQPAPEIVWSPADGNAAQAITAFVERADRNGRAAYVIPGTVAQTRQARAADVQQMQVVLVDLDHGDIEAKLAYLVRHIGTPTLDVASGGITPGGQRKRHLYWRLTEAAVGEDIARICEARRLIAEKVGGDPSFKSAHQPIRVAGSIHAKQGRRTLVQILNHDTHDHDLGELLAAIRAMPPLEGEAEPLVQAATTERGRVTKLFTRHVREGGVDGVTRFEAVSRVSGHWIRRAHEGYLTRDEAWQEIAAYNAACISPPWPDDRLRQEVERLWNLHGTRNGPPLLREARPDTPASPLPTFSLGALLDDTSPMPEDIIGPRVLTRGGLLVLGGAPKVGKSDFLISWLVHMAAGAPFLGFTPPRPLRVFYLQAEIQYHYLRERMQQIALPTAVIAAARDTFIATPKLKLLLDAEGVARVTQAIRAAFREAPPDIIVIDPIRNLFDGGPDGGGENDNTAMMFFLKDRVELLREAVNPDAGVILAHHTRKTNRKMVAEDPFQALSGASALRGFYTTGLLMHRPDEDSTVRRLEIELRNGPALPGKLIDKVKGAWIELNPMNERLVRAEAGAKHDAERDRKREVILSILLDEAAGGKLYTSTQFREAFENQRGLGSQSTIRDRINVLTTKGYIRFVRDGRPYSHPIVRSRFGYLCVEGMVLHGDEEVDTETGEITRARKPVVPTHYKSPMTGACLEIQDPSDWPIQEADDA